MFPRLFAKIKAFFCAAWLAVRPGPAALRGASLGALAAGILAYVVFVILTNQGPLLFAIPAILGLLLLGGLLLLLGQGVAWAIGLLARIPWGYRWSALAGFVLVNMALMGVKSEAGLAVAGLVVVIASLIGAGIGSVRPGSIDRPGWRPGWRGLTRVQRVVALSGLVLGTAALAGGLPAYALWPGAAQAAVVDSAKTSGAPVARVSLPNPGLRGEYAVKTLTYGSGSDRYRREYGAEAELKTSPVNGTKLLESSWKGFTGQLRTFAWGFDAAALPLNGRVWYPEVKPGSANVGPFPLVLMVHGNHSMMDFSDPGYAYLGELLASRGYIFVSVDENFINGGTTDLLDGFSNENDARGWLLLEHLRQWHAWNSSAGNPFSGLVDIQQIAVGGHSRGGEAAAIAAAFNRLPYYPDDYGLAFHYNYDIRAVVAIAPIDGQYNPAWRGTTLKDVNYFLIHGSNDSDVVSFSGLNQYERVSFDPQADWFKSAVYVYRANHGQFNTTWGDRDNGGLAGGFLNRGALLTAEEQRQAAEVYISAFLDAALKGQRGYLPLLQDARAAGEGWLPQTIYINRFDQAGDTLVAGYEEDVDLGTATLAGASAAGYNLSTWREQRVHSKWGGRESNAVYLSWNDAGTASYTLSLPAEGLTPEQPGALIFNLADANQDPQPAYNFNKAKETGEKPKVRQPVDLSVQLEDTAGKVASVKLSAYRMVQPQLAADLYKLKFFERVATSEPILQSYVIPLADFQHATPGFNPLNLRAVRFVFDQTRLASLILDGVGFRRLQ